MEMSAAVALARFGFGGGRGMDITGRVRAWLHDQLDRPDPALQMPGRSSADGLAAVSTALAPSANPAGGQAKLVAIYTGFPDEMHRILAYALDVRAGYRERLVWFWANHFTISCGPLVTVACAGAYLREAIRPYVTGRFADMLLAVMRHPAMLAYLDQVFSAGPDSPAGQHGHAGLNENLARECLELHTVTPAAGYTQQDVVAFAKILTGWSYEAQTPPIGFRFRPFYHEPGEKRVLGHVWPAGEDGGRQILLWLGTHPTTYRHLAKKLVRHFIDDDPDDADVRAIERVLGDTGGDLHAAAIALVDLASSWRPLTKLRSPQEYVIAVMRACGAPAGAPPRLANIAALLGQPMLQAPSPTGWSDDGRSWASPAAMLQRIDFAYTIATGRPPLDIAEVEGHTVGPLLSQDTAREIAEASTRSDALALLLSSPEMQRR